MPGTQFVEYISFVASEAFLADNSMVDNLRAWLDKNGEGCLSVFTGFQVEDPTRANFFVLWKTHEHFIKASQHPEFSAFMAIFNPLVKSDLSVQQIDFDDDPTTAFSAPITELSLVKPKEGHAQEEVDAVILHLKESAAVVPGVQPPLVWGNIRTTPQYAMAAGWDSVEAHQNALQVSPVDLLSGKLFGISDLTVHHISLKRTK